MAAASTMLSPPMGTFPRLAFYSAAIEHEDGYNSAAKELAHLSDCVLRVLYDVSALFREDRHWIDREKSHIQHQRHEMAKNASCGSQDRFGHSFSAPVHHTMPPGLQLPLSVAESSSGRLPMRGMDASSFGECQGSIQHNPFEEQVPPLIKSCCSFAGHAEEERMVEEVNATPWVPAADRRDVVQEQGKEELEKKNENEREELVEENELGAHNDSGSGDADGSQHDDVDGVDEEEADGGMGKEPNGEKEWADEDEDEQEEDERAFISQQCRKKVVADRDLEYEKQDESAEVKQGERNDARWKADDTEWIENMAMKEEENECRADIGFVDVHQNLAVPLPVDPMDSGLSNHVDMSICLPRQTESFENISRSSSSLVNPTNYEELSLSYTSALRSTPKAGVQHQGRPNISGQVPISISLAEVQELLRGTWEGESGETYVFRFDPHCWFCTRTSSDGSKRFPVRWINERSALQWGKTYSLHPAELRQRPGVATWYSNHQPRFPGQRQKPRFVWRRRAC
eukprot:TRINITY_DN40567_c0_g1_i1.p1 TRINITY_DN40567_c0_g1~~TRINITY_DN40567_c0_g1_i1.p1  ORF type:complete len:531 (-),score=70.88 TRINITY_DN40567_c0_g1_i1:23-1567(-)